MEEKRKFIRFKAPFCVQYSIEGSKEEFSGVIKDISMGGVRLALDTSSVLDINRPANLAIMFPDDALKVEGKAIWSKDVGDMKEVGFCFGTSGDCGREQIHKYILKHFKAEFTRGWWQM